MVLCVAWFIICDDLARITRIDLGWPGSVHDNRVWSNSDVFVNKELYFGDREYLLGDSAFAPSSVMVPAFKKGHITGLTEEKAYFNTKLAKIRIKSEHCIGLLKARFQRVKGHRRVIGGPKDLRSILRVTMCACIVHNLLISNPISKEWLEDPQDLPENDELNQIVDSRIGNERRDQLFAYMLEIR